MTIKRSAPPRSSIIAALTLAFGVSAPAQAQQVEIIDHSALRVCADPDAMPYSRQDGSGIENRIAELLARDLGVPVRYTWFPSTMGFYRRTLNARRCDIVIGAAESIEFAQATIPYYRSSFAILTRSSDGIAPTSLEDDVLRGKRIGVQARTPVSELVAQDGIGTLQAYSLMVDSRITSVGTEMTQDLLAGKIDAAVIWGPVAAWQARQHPELTLSVLGDEDNDVRLSFAIAMAVRKGEPRWRGRIDNFIRDHREEIDAILADAGVPLLPLEDRMEENTP